MNLTVSYRCNPRADTVNQEKMKLFTLEMPSMSSNKQNISDNYESASKDSPVKSKTPEITEDSSKDSTGEHAVGDELKVEKKTEEPIDAGSIEITDADKQM